MRKYIFKFNAVVETEVALEVSTQLGAEEVGDLLDCATDVDPATETITVDEVKDDFNEELHELLLSLVPDNLKQNCVSMAFTDIKATLIRE